MGRKQIQTILEKLLFARIKVLEEKSEVEDLTTHDATEILRIKAALEADRPTADLIMTVIFNQFTYLHKEFPLQNDDEFQSIMRFLESFYTHTQNEFLSKTGTHKDGLAMNIKQEILM